MVGYAVASPVRAKRVFTQPRADQFIPSGSASSFLDDHASLIGKLAVVTGAASGTGFYVAEQLAVRFQMAVVLVDKDMAKLKGARELIQVAARGDNVSLKEDPKLYVVAYIADDLSLIKAAANDIRAIARKHHQSRLQLLIHLAPQDTYVGLTSQSVERNYSRNFLAPFCFTEYLIGLIKAAYNDKTTPTPRCILSTAPLARMPPVNTTNLASQLGIESDDDTALSFYAASQVFLAAVSQYMAKRYGGTMELSCIVTERGASSGGENDTSQSSLGRLYSFGSSLLDYSPSQRAVPFLESALGVERKSVLEMDLPDPIRVTDDVAKETYFAAKAIIRGKLVRSPSEH